MLGVEANARDLAIVRNAQFNAVNRVIKELGLPICECQGHGNKEKADLTRSPTAHLYVCGVRSLEASAAERTLMSICLQARDRGRI